jgi:hypothetical protein
MPLARRGILSPLRLPVPPLARRTGIVEVGPRPRAKVHGSYTPRVRRRGRLLIAGLLLLAAGDLASWTAGTATGSLPRCFCVPSDDLSQPFDRPGGEAMTEWDLSWNEATLRPLGEPIQATLRRRLPSWFEECLVAVGRYPDTLHDVWAVEVPSAPPGWREFVTARSGDAAVIDPAVVGDWESKSSLLSLRPDGTVAYQRREWGRAGDVVVLFTAPRAPPLLRDAELATSRKLLLGPAERTLHGQGGELFRKVD